MSNYPVLIALYTQYLANTEELLRRTRDKVGGSAMVNLKRFLWEYSHGMCIVCELPTILAPGESNSAEVGHIIPASAYAHSKVRAGYVPGNLAIMCKECNRDAGDFPFHLHLDKVRADLIPTEWPAFTKKWGGISAHRESARKIRAGKGLPF